MIDRSAILAEIVSIEHAFGSVKNAVLQEYELNWTSA